MYVRGVHKSGVSNYPSANQPGFQYSHMTDQGTCRKRKYHVGEGKSKMTSTSALLKGQGSTKFADRWPEMKPVVLKLLKQEPVTRREWQDLFW